MNQEAVLVIGYRLLANVLTTACHAASARREEILTVEQLERKPCVTNSRGGEERKRRRDYVTFVEDRSHDCLDVPYSPSQLGSFCGEGDPRPSNESEAKVAYFQIYCLDVTH